MFLVFFVLLLASGAAPALPTGAFPPEALVKKSFSLPLKRTQVDAGMDGRMRKRGGIYSGNTGLGDFLDLFVAYIMGSSRP